MKPHKHAELIKAWADGAEIEALFFNDARDYWQSTSNPAWSNVNLRFRIKPELKKDPLKIIANLIHYPQCWDDVAYPTLEDAVIEVCEDFNCTNEDGGKPDLEYTLVQTERLGWLELREVCLQEEVVNSIRIIRDGENPSRIKSAEVL